MHPIFSIIFYKQSQWWVYFRLICDISSHCLVGNSYIFGIFINIRGQSYIYDRAISAKILFGGKDLNNYIYFYIFGCYIFRKTFNLYQFVIHDTFLFLDLQINGWDRIIRAWYTYIIEKQKKWEKNKRFSYLIYGNTLIFVNCTLGTSKIYDLIFSLPVYLD